MEQAVRDRCPGTDIKNSLYVLENGSENLSYMVQAWLEQNFPSERKINNE